MLLCVCTINAIVYLIFNKNFSYGKVIKRRYESMVIKSIASEVIYSSFDIQVLPLVRNRIMDRSLNFSMLNSPSFIKWVKICRNMIRCFPRECTAPGKPLGLPQLLNRMNIFFRAC